MTMKKAINNWMEKDNKAWSVMCDMRVTNGQVVCTAAGLAVMLFTTSLGYYM